LSDNILATFSFKFLKVNNIINFFIIPKGRRKTLMSNRR